jgi:hypothetical protein
MAIRALVHIHNEETIACEIDEMPKPSDSFVVLRHVRKKDGKPLQFVDDDATSFIYPFTRIAFIELFEEVERRENVVGLFRESGDQRRRS